MKNLAVLLNGASVGMLQADARGKLAFAYTPEWRANPLATPLSLSLPLAAEKHDSDTITAVLWGLLPDNEHTLDRWARKFQVSARNPLALLTHVGEDCAGAAQFVRPERLDAILSGAEDDITWLDEIQIAERLKQLRQDSGAGRAPTDSGQFSLAGAKSKTALLYWDQRWGVPQGGIPTTHILKPPTDDFDGYVENEYFCLQLARELGLPTPQAWVRHFGDEICFVIERYDRLEANGRLIRVHQEDFCQALGVMPQRKYQNDGGPSPAAMAAVLREYSNTPREDLETFLLALAFNWFIGGTDAHAKNYSLLLGEAGSTRLAPLYDLSSVLPYPRQVNIRKATMAMRIGSHYRWWDIRPQDWLSLAAELELEREQVISVLADTARILPDMAAGLAARVAAQDINHPVISRIVDGIADAGRRFLGALAAMQKHASDLTT